MEEHRSLPEASFDTRKLYELLRPLKPGEFMSYGVLSAAIGRDVQSAARHHLATARRMLLREHILVECVAGDGVKRLADGAIVSTGEQQRRKLRNAARLGIRKLAATQDFASLSPEEQRRHNTHASLFGAVLAVSGRKALARTQAAVAEAANAVVAPRLVIDGIRGVLRRPKPPAS